ncbi:hypothetical protein ACSFB8_03665 [Enterococcus faecalis]
MKTAKKKLKEWLLLFFTILFIVLATLIWQKVQTGKVTQITKEAQIVQQIKVIEKWQETTDSEKKTINKTIKVANSSQVPVFVRASFEEVFRYLARYGQESQKDLPLPASLTKQVFVEADLPVLEPFNQNQLSTDGFVNVTEQVRGLENINKQYGGKITVWLKKKATDDTELLDTFEDCYEKNFFYVFDYNQQTVMQKMSGTLHLLNPQVTKVSDWRFEALHLRYHVFLDGYRFVTKNWAHSQLPSPYEAAETNAATGFTVLGHRGVRNGEAFDYQLTATGLGVNHLLTPTISTFPYGEGKYPNHQYNRFSSFIFSDQTHQDDRIMIQFGELSDFTNIKANTWIYNPDDGWFYYAARLNQQHQATEESGVTTSLIKSVDYGKHVAANSFIHYELLPKVEVVQVNDPTALQRTFLLQKNGSENKASKAILSYLTGLQ